MLAAQIIAGRYKEGLQNGKGVCAYRGKSRVFDRTYEILQDNPSVISASRVTGPYDVIAVVQEEDLGGVHDLVTEQIHHLNGVLRTTTSVAVG